MEADGVLRRHVQARVLEHAERGRVRHMRVQHAARLRHQAVYREVDIESGVLDQPAACHDRATEVQLQQIAGFHLRPQQPEGRKVEPLGVSGHEHRHVIVDALAETEARRQAMTGGEIDPRASFCVAAPYRFP